MSTHTLKAKRRHPDTQRERITVGHITFALIAGDAVQAKDRKPLFSGLIEPEMEKELRRVAFRMKTILGDNDES
jgi:hypothetical protein